jgi:CheY-like chemotaxis protein
MVVDDDDDIIYVVRMMLESAGHEVYGFTSGEECLEKLKREVPDYILLDIEMPDMDGWKTLREIKKDEKLKDIPVAMLTARKLNPEIIEREEMAMLVDYIYKPFTKKDVIETLKQVYDF